MNNEVLLEVKDLKTYFPLREGTVRAVDGVDVAVKRGTTVGLVGESGCGKSVTAFSILQIVGRPGRIMGGQILYHRRMDARGTSQTNEVIDLASLNPRSAQMRAIRGREIAMIFQEPMTSLSMMHTIGFQIVEAILLHQKITKVEARERAIEMLSYVGIPMPSERYDAYPFQLSGGMRQRAMIAMALVCRPSLLIADEPTTALDVTIQAQIMELMQRLQDEMDMAIMLITHDLGVVAEMCDEVAVMYLGEVVEHGDVRSVFENPLHPYTRALMRSIPKLGEGRRKELEPIEGTVPDAFNRPSGCPFHPRCTEAPSAVCAEVHPEMIRAGSGRMVRCVLYQDNAEAAI
jgi:oligopeptide/dipeptide ABC transporter ATP-binding protein